MPRILLVEDERDVRLIIEHVLIDAGYEVDTAETMTAGRELLKRGSHDLVLADAKLPDGSGMDVWRRFSVSSCLAWLWSMGWLR